MEEKNKQHTCTCQATILMEQLNKFINPYAFSYPKYENLSNCNECPYQLMDSKSEDLSEEQKTALIKLYGDYCITPQYLTGKEISDEHKLKLISEYLDENRTLFRREEERIIYTEAFRRLQYKTQVMVNSASDDQRTRLLHSLEVQKIARKIAIALKANYELAETIAISHDIGHAPFGHAGENAIKRYMESHLVGSFSHALQSVKVLDFLCSHRALKPKGLKGLGISDLVLEGILKHDSDSFIDNLSLAEYRLQYNCPNLYKPVNVTNVDLYRDGEVYIGGIESQIVCWADKIAYLGHDWEEFVAVGLLEVMLSRINKIIIELDEFVSNQDAIKYSHISIEERSKLLELNKCYNDLKGILADKNYSDKISEDDAFVKCIGGLTEIIDGIADSDKSKNENYILFSKEQYATLYAFFKVAYCWMIITKKKPKRIGGKIDIIFVLYKYLNDTTSHRTVPALIKALIESCGDSLLSAAVQIDRDTLIKSCNENWQVRKVELEKEKANSKKIKSELRKTFAVHFNGEYAEATEYINKFVYQEFIDSTRVKFMTQKAEMIVGKLLDYYYKNHEMLPLKYRNRIEFESCCPQILDNTKKLLAEYYEEKVDKAVQNDKANSYEAPFNFSNLRDNIIHKISKICLDNHTISTKATPKTLKKVMLDLLSVNDDFAKDAIKLRVIADYVSGMTDRMAEMKYNEICSSGTQWSKAYSERGTFNL